MSCRENCPHSVSPPPLSLQVLQDRGSGCGQVNHALCQCLHSQCPGALAGIPMETGPHSGLPRDVGLATFSLRGHSRQSTSCSPPRGGPPSPRSPSLPQGPLPSRGWSSPHEVVLPPPGGPPPRGGPPSPRWPSPPRWSSPPEVVLPPEVKTKPSASPSEMHSPW